MDIFVRHGKRVVAVTEPGRAILDIARRVLGDIENLKQVGEEFTEQDHGRADDRHHPYPGALHPAAGHPALHQRYPGVRVSLRQGSPDQSWQVVKSGEADIAIATEGDQAV